MILLQTITSMSLKFITIGFGMVCTLGLLMFVLWCSYATSLEDKLSEELEFDVKTGVTTLIPAARNWINVSYTQMSSQSYCTISECKIINCNSISSPDSGEVASAFLDKVFKVQCPATSTISKLIFANSNFAHDKLDELWLMSAMPIEYIKFDNCNLNAIDKNAFALSIFTNTNSFSIINTNVGILNKYIFDELSNLHNLVIQNNLVMKAEYNLLINVAATLETIELDKSIENIQVLLNITSGEQLLKVQLLSLQGNNIPNLSNDILRAFPNVISVYMDSSRIQSIHKNAFESCLKIKQIFLNNNELTTIPEGIFRPLLLYSPGFKITITGNSWNCNCDLKWIQDMVIKMPNMMIKIPICKKPDENYDKSFLNAIFCKFENPPSFQVSTTSKSISESINNSTQSSIAILCQNTPVLLKNFQKAFSILDYQYPSKPGFILHQLKNASVIINVLKNNSRAALLWFNTDENNIKQINCLKNIKRSIILNNLQADTSYTVCLLEETISPFNCLAFKTLPSKNLRIWLSSGDKTLVLSIFTVTAFLFCLLGCGSCFLIIKRNPTLLKGSKRIIMVKRGQVSALILPKGVDRNSFEKDRNQKVAKFENYESTLPEVDYLTPIKKQNHLSNTYESIGIKIPKNFGIIPRESDGETPPPLPPHPFHGVIPSVSLLMDSEHKMTDGTNEIHDDTEIYSCIQPK